MIIFKILTIATGIYLILKDISNVEFENSLIGFVLLVIGIGINYI